MPKQEIPLKPLPCVSAREHRSARRLRGLNSTMKKSYTLKTMTAFFNLCAKITASGSPHRSKKSAKNRYLQKYKYLLFFQKVRSCHKQQTHRFYICLKKQTYGNTRTDSERTTIENRSVETSTPYYKYANRSCDVLTQAAEVKTLMATSPSNDMPSDSRISPRRKNPGRKDGKIRPTRRLPMISTPKPLSLYPNTQRNSSI